MDAMPITEVSNKSDFILSANDRHTYAINMPALINDNCKVCYGTGRNGRNVKTGEINHCRKCLMKNLHERIVELVKIKRDESKHTG